MLSERAAEQFGFSPKTTVSRDELHARFHPSDRAWMDQLIKEVHDPAGTGWFDTEHRVMRLDGTSRWLNVRKQVTFKEGRAQRAVVVTVDVTEQKMAEARLQEQEMLVREAAELAKVGGWGFDPETLQSDWTPRLRKCTASRSSLPPARESSRLLCDEHRTLLISSLETAVRDGLAHDLELKLTAADGVTRWVRSICRPMWRMARWSECVGRCKTLPTANARKRNCKPAKDDCGWRWKLPELLPSCGTYQTTKSFVITAPSPLLPVTQNEPETLDDVRAKVHPDDLAAFDARLSECLAGGTDYRNEYRVLRDDGTSASVEDYGFLDRSNDGSPLALPDWYSMSPSGDNWKNSSGKHRKWKRLPAGRWRGA